MENTIYTIGYAGFPERSTMLAVLRRYGIRVIIDVRSVPFSHTFPQYNSGAFQNYLSKNGIYYRNYALGFGARQTDTRYFTNNQLDFERFAGSDVFQDACQKMIKTVEAGYVPCLFCAEKDPIICHRSILIGRELMRLGLDVEHIHSDWRTESQEQLQDRLVSMLFPNKDQANLWEDSYFPPDEMAGESYRIQNRKIGYRLKG